MKTGEKALSALVSGRGDTGPMLKASSYEMI